MLSAASESVKTEGCGLWMLNEIPRLAALLSLPGASAREWEGTASAPCCLSLSICEALAPPGRLLPAFSSLHSTLTVAKLASPVVRTTCDLGLSGDSAGGSAAPLGSRLEMQLPFKRTCLSTLRHAPCSARLIHASR